MPLRNNKWPDRIGPPRDSFFGLHSSFDCACIAPTPSSAAPPACHRFRRDFSFAFFSIVDSPPLFPCSALFESAELTGVAIRIRHQHPSKHLPHLLDRPRLRNHIIESVLPVIRHHRRVRVTARDN